MRIIARNYNITYQNITVDGIQKLKNVNLRRKLFATLQELIDYFVWLSVQNHAIGKEDAKNWWFYKISTSVSI